MLRRSGDRTEKDDTQKSAAPEELDDEEQMRRMGYQSTLYRGLDAFMNFAVGLAEVGVIVSISQTFGMGLVSGGPVLIIWAFSFAFMMSLIAAISMAEICAAYPTAGSVYHWAAQLCPLEYAPFWSYICAFANFIGNAAGDASFANGFGIFISAAISASGYEPLSVHYQVLISISVLFLWTFINFFRIDHVGWINTVAAIVHLGTLVLIFILMFTVATTLNSAKVVFTEYYDDTGFDSVFYSCLISLVAGMWAFAGYEASSHLSEETTHGDRASSAGMIWTVLASGLLGLSFIIILLFLTINIGAVVNGTTTVNTGNAG